MAYDHFKILRSSAVPMPIENVDTDQIIPARFLKAIGGKGYLRALPLPHGWFAVRDLPAPQGKTFHELWKAKR